MENLVYVLPALVCPLGMVAMMWFMGRGSKQKDQRVPVSVEQMREEHARLAAELERIDGQSTPTR